MCKQCPHLIGDILERDCDFPNCYPICESDSIPDHLHFTCEVCGKSTKDMREYDTNTLVCTGCGSLYAKPRDESE